MERKLEFLLVEDAGSDAMLVERALRAGGIEFSARRVETREDFLRAIEERAPDMILADCKLPHFDGRSALRLASERLPLVPVIIVTGSMIDEVAVELLREGAADYILKDRLSRLAPAVRRALVEADGIRDRKAAEEALRNSELRYRRLFECAPDGILLLDGETGKILDANPYLTNLIGCTADDLIGRTASEIGAIKDSKAAEDAFAQLPTVDYIRFEHLALKSKSGAAIDVEVVSNAYPVAGTRFIQCNIHDIRKRVAAQRLLEEQLSELRLFQRVTVDRELRMQELEIQNAALKAQGAW